MPKISQVVQQQGEEEEEPRRGIGQLLVAGGTESWLAGAGAGGLI